MLTSLVMIVDKNDITRHPPVFLGLVDYPKRKEYNAYPLSHPVNRLRIGNFSLYQTNTERDDTIRNSHKLPK